MVYYLIFCYKNDPDHDHDKKKTNPDSIPFQMQENYYARTNT